MNKKNKYTNIGVAAILGLSIVSKIVMEKLQNEGKETLQNQCADQENIIQGLTEDKEILQNQCADQENIIQGLTEDKEILQNQCADQENIIQRLTDENNWFREKEYRKQQEEKQKEDEIRAIEDFSFEGMNDMESIS